MIVTQNIYQQELCEFYNNISDTDKEELTYILKEDILNNFISMILSSIDNNNEIYLVKNNENIPIAIGGIVKIPNSELKIGKVWLLVSKKFKNYKIFLYRYIKNRILNYKSEFDILYNYIYKSNFNALNWLYGFGFKSNPCLFNSNFKIFYFVKGDKEIDLQHYINKLP